MVTCAVRPGLDKEKAISCRTQNYSVTPLQDQKLLKCTRKEKQLKVLCRLCDYVVLQCRHQGR